MLIITIILGLIGLSVVVVVHELGHFFAARAVGVEVEAFSIGWGPKVAGFKRKGTEWRLSALPIGGYCRMKGEESFRKALEEKAGELPREPGTYYGASPWKRIIIATAGPVANLVFAFIVFAIVSTISYSFQTYPNRIILASEFPLNIQETGPFPADLAGLMSGDRIVAIDGAPISDYSELLERITSSANKRLSLTIDRNGIRYDKTIIPALDKDTGGGRIGVYSWSDPVVAEVSPCQAAANAGLVAGDRIVSIDGKPIRHTIEAYSALEASKPDHVRVVVDRGGNKKEFSVALQRNAKGESDIGISYATIAHTARAVSSVGAAIQAGATETLSMISLTAKGLGSLFQGVRILKALSGPARIIGLIGQSAATGIQQASTGGLSDPLRVLAFLSIALFFMNLLPIPALDGGQILMFVVEGIRRRSLKPVTVYRYQLIGGTFILAIFVIASIGDYLFYTAK